MDMSKYDVDAPMPEVDVTGKWSRAQMMLDLAKLNNWTVKDAYKSVSAGRGHWVVIGTASDIADQMELWFTEKAADGFNVMPPVFPGDLSEFVDLVIPELQRRGLFRTEYEGKTLRENLGVARPKHFAAN
jgi:alkanesulfonate monooxygenase SsuD/methylene tetrahydromethanopterin reductase-like flavin-dependent oxidoreductase (luciferase family)